MPNAAMNAFNNLLLGGILSVLALYYGKGIFIPMAFAALFAMLLVPIVGAMERRGVHRLVSALAALSVALGGLVGLSLLLRNQIAGVARNLPALQAQAEQRVELLQEYLGGMDFLAGGMQEELLTRGINVILDSLGMVLRTFVGITAGFLFNIGIILVLTFLFLVYRTRMRQFMLRIVPPSDRGHMNSVIDQVSTVANSYLVGVVTVVAILSVLNSVGLLLMRIEHALFLGVLAGILNVIPYIGSVVGSVIPMIIAFLTKESLWYVPAVGLLFLVIQLTESYVFTPRITGSKVKLNPLAAVLVLVTGGQIWGIIGMILSIPLLGIVKVILDNVKRFKPFGYLIGRGED